LATTEREPHLEQPISRDGSVARGLLDRGDLLQMLDRAVSKRVTVISAPPGSGKTSLLRAWADRSGNARRVAFVSVERDQQDAQRFWSAVLDAIRSPARSIDPEAQPAPAAAFDGDQLVDTVVWEVAEQAEPVVLIIDDLHELRSTDAFTQLDYFVANMPSNARVVLSSRRDPQIRLHQLRLADAIAEIRAGDLRFTEGETRELLAGSGIELSGDGLFFSHLHLHGGPAPVRRFLPQLVDLIWNRRIDPGKVFDLTLPLDHVAEGYRAMDERRAIKTLLRP